MDINNNVGLVNFGNTCFLNSSIQLIMNATSLCTHLANTSELLETKLKKYVKTIRDYMNPDTGTMEPKILYVSYKRLNANYSGFSQEDAEEFITYTMDDIISNVRILKFKNNAHVEFIDKTEKLMTYTLQTKVTYANKPLEPSVTKYRETMLVLPIPINNLTLENCYSAYLTQKDNEKLIEYSMHNHPKYLFVSIKRFINMGRISKKRQESVEIPLETDLFGPKYILKGFVLHSGSMQCGHYIAYGSRMIDSNKKWFCYNDNSVTEASLQIVEQQSKMAYVFLYSKSV